MLDTPLAPWPCFTKEETEAVQRVLESNRVNYWTGEEGRTFEREFADFARAVARGFSNIASFLTDFDAIFLCKRTAADDE